MKCEQFDEVRQLAMANYGKLGVKAEILSEEDQHVSQPPFDWLSVTVKVTPVVPNPQPWAEEWFYGGVIEHIRKPVPLGVRPIDNQKLIPCCEAAKKLPVGFPLPDASGSLFWPLVPGADEPFYRFSVGETTIDIGAYTGKVHK